MLGVSGVDEGLGLGFRDLGFKGLGVKGLPTRPADQAALEGGVLRIRQAWRGFWLRV